MTYPGQIERPLEAAALRYLGKTYQQIADHFGFRSREWARLLVAKGARRRRNRERKQP